MIELVVVRKSNPVPTMPPPPIISGPPAIRSQVSLETLPPTGLISIFEVFSATGSEP